MPLAIKAALPSSTQTVTGASGTGSVATLSFAGPYTAPLGSTIIVTGVSTAGYNGTYVVTASSSTSVSYANTTTGGASGGSVYSIAPGGSVTLAATNTASDYTLTLPAATGTVALTASPTFSGTVTATTITSPSATALTFQYGGTTGATLDTSGNLLVGTTAANPVSGNVSGVTVSPVGFLNVQRSAGSAGSMAIGNNTVGTLMNFYYTGSGSAVNVGSIVITTTTSSFVGTSDYRLKEDIAPLTSGISTIAALKPISYKWKVDQSVGEGFIAHELGEVIPLALFGAKDALNEDGSIKPQGIDMTKIVPHLVAAIQELSAKNDALEARLAALEAK